MASFASDDVSGPISLQGTANFCFTVALPGGGEGRGIDAVVDALRSPDGLLISLTAACASAPRRRPWARAVSAFQSDVPRVATRA